MIRVHVEEGSERVAIYDWLRLIATLFVVIGHSTYLSIQITYGGVSYELPSTLSEIFYSPVFVWWRKVASWVYGFHMPLFFMLSGAVFALRPIDRFDRILKSKVKRLIIPYFVYGWLFLFPVKRYGNFYNNDTLKIALNVFLSGQESGHLWFILALFWCIIVFTILCKGLGKININSVYMILLICGIIQLTYSYIPFDILGFKSGLNYIFYFAIGYVFECERKMNKQWNLKKTLFAYSILLIVEILNEKYDILNEFFVIIVGSFMTYIFADLCSRFFKKIEMTCVWKGLARNLFYVYLFHDPLEYIVLKLFMERNWLSNPVGCVVYLFSRTVIVFLVAVILGECSSKIKKGLSFLLEDKEIKQLREN